MNNPRFDDRAATIANDTAAAVGAMASDAGTEAEEMASRATAAVGKAYGQARGQARGAVAAAATAVDQHPGIALLAVGLVCGALGFLLARR